MKSQFSWFSAIIGLLLLGLVTFFSPNADARRWVYDYNHTDLNWYSLETEHFVFHYPVSKKKEGNKHYLTAEYSARRFAVVAEENWADMCKQFNYYLKEKIHVMVLNQSDTLEGFTIPTWDWIVMGAHPGGGQFSYARGRMEWFSTVFAHEFAHVVSLKANASTAESNIAGVTVGGLYSNGRNIGPLNHSAIGLQVPIADSDSVWWVEGGAEYWSGATNVNWWTSSRDRTIRTSVLEDRLLGYEEWQTRMGKRQTGWNEGERYYQGGHSFALYIRERFGPHVFAQFALEYGKGWRPQFEKVVKEVTGVDSEVLYYDWKKYITKRYTEQYDRVKAKGEVVGKEILSGRPPWRYTSPAGRDKWIGTKSGLKERGWFGRKTKREREAQKEATGRWQFEPRVSPDGKYIGFNKRTTISIAPSKPTLNYAMTGKAAHADPELLFQVERDEMAFRGTFDHGWDFVPNKDAVVVTGTEDVHPQNPWVSLFSLRLETDGYNWNQLYYYEYPEYRTTKYGKVKVESRIPKKGKLAKRTWKGKWYAIPNTLRGHDPAVSPDGKKLAFMHYTDGTINLATIDLDGKNKKLLTNYTDGTWMRIVDWSPDGKKLVLMIFRNYQQNLYTINADGTELKPIMMDEWEEQDPHWSAVDGKIYFSADPDGIANIYSYDPNTKEFLQITNVINGAYSPQITNDGDLVYLYNTANGWKYYAVPKDQFMNEPASDFFSTDFGAEYAGDFLTEKLDYSRFKGKETKYNPLKAMSAPFFLPEYRMVNDSRTNWGIQGGGTALFMDYVQFNMTQLSFLLGEDMQAGVSYVNDMWIPTIGVGANYFKFKTDQGFLLDEDNNPETIEDQKIYEIKRIQQYKTAFMYTGYRWNNNIDTFFVLQGFDFSVKNVSDAMYQPYMVGVNTNLNINWSNNLFFRGSPNPYFGRNIDFNWSYGWADIVFEDTAGVTVDDGQELDEYSFNQYMFTWNEIFPIPTLGSKILRNARKRRHVIQVDGQFGFIDRNVDAWNEMNAGGRHPYFMGFTNSLQPNTQFAGYPRASLRGETMMILNTVYRFPITRPEQHWLVGPLYVYGLYAQLGGTMGNLWSYRPPSNPSKFYLDRFEQRIAYDDDDIEREWPFYIDDKDGRLKCRRAYKNGNCMLFDASFELRLTSGLYHTSQWNSFARLSYGFQSVRGYGDVDGDDIFDTNDSALGDELSNESEPAGFRFYLGIGTGW